jgi:hypothetical protein
MSPEVDQILLRSASQIGSNVVPLLPDGYAQGHASLLSIMMILSAQEYDRAAEIRVRENTDMRETFRALAPSVDDNDLRTRLEAAPATIDESLAISALNAGNAELRQLLIALQDHMERKGDDAAQARIWEVLRRSAERRLVRLG